MVNMRLASPTRFFLRPTWWDEDEDTWPNLTMTEGIDVYEEGDQVIAKMAVPGVPAENIDVTFEDGVLRVTAHTEETEEDKKKNRVVYRKDRVMSFDYTTTLPRAVDPKSLTADVDNGVLTITAKIAETAKPQKITVGKKIKK